MFQSRLLCDYDDVGVKVLFLPTVMKNIEDLAFLCNWDVLSCHLILCWPFGCDSHLIERQSSGNIESDRSTGKFTRVGLSGKFGVDVYEWRPWSSSAGFPVVGEGRAQEDKTGNKLFLISGPENALVGAVFWSKKVEKADLSELWQLLHILELLSSFYIQRRHYSVLL